MKKVYLLLSVICLSFSAIGQTVVNEGFEESGTFPPPGWTLAGSNTSYLFLASGTESLPSTSGPHGGTYYCEWESWDAGNGESAILGSPVVSYASRGGATTTVSIWWYRDVTYYNTSSYSAEGVSLYVNSSPSTISGGTLVGFVPRAGAEPMTGSVTGTSTTTSDGWYQYTFTIPTSFEGATNYLVFYFYSEYGANCYMDDIQYTNYNCSAGTITGTPTVCGGATTALSDAATGGTWSSSNTAVGTVNSSGVVTGISTGTTTISYGGLSACSTLFATQVVTVNAPTVTTPSNQAVCNTALETVNFTGTAATYAWTNTNTSIGLGASGSGNISFTATNAGSAPIAGTITVTPSGSGCTGPAHTFTITANPTPSVTDPTNQTVCNSTSTSAVTLTGSAVAGTTYNWTNSNTAIGLAASGSATVPAFTGTNGGNSAIAGTITITPTANGCNGSNQAFSITVNPTPAVTVPSSETICNGAASGALNFTGTVAGETYTWTNTNTSIGLGASGSGNISSFTGTNAGVSPISGTVTVSPSANSCAGSSQAFSITVNQTPTVSAISSQTLCNGATTTAVSFTGSGASFGWANTNSTIGLAASGSGNIAAFTATNSGTTATSGTITVTPSVGACNGSTQNFTITVNPSPSVTDPSNQTVANTTATSAVTLTGSGVAGTTYTWTNSNTAIGLGASGSSTVPSFTGTNTGASPISGTITITPTASSCNGPTQNFTITVDPTPTVSTPTNITVYNGLPVPAVIFSSTVTGTTYTWTNSNTAIGLAASGSGNIASFTAAGVGIATVTVTPHANGFAGPTIVFAIMVNLSPIPNQTICAGAGTTPVNFTDSASGVTYTWTNTNTAIGLAASGTGNIASFYATNSGPTAISGTITVSPSVGLPVSFVIAVNPTPTVSTPGNQSVCNGVATTAVTLTGSSVPATAYNWTNSNTAIGLAASGNTTVPSFTATNTTTSPATGTITITPSAAGCNGSPASFTITANPIPAVTAPANQTVCNGVASTAVAFTGTVSGETYSWTNSNTGIGLGAGPTAGNIAAFTATNAGTAAIAGTITVSPSANGCTGSNQTFSITVNPTPAITGIAPGTQSACAGASMPLETISGNGVAGIGYTWTNTNSSIGLASTGTGNIAAFTTTNAGITQLVSTIAVTPIANGCVGTAQNFTETANPIPTVNAVSNQAYCTGVTSSAVTFSGAVAGTTFTWSNSNTATGLAAGPTAGNLPTFTTTNATTAPISGTISVSPAANGCTGTSQTFSITVNPTPSLTMSTTALTVCNAAATSAAVTFTSTTTGAAFNWTNSATSIGLGSTGSGNIPIFTAINTSTTGATVASIVVTPSANGCNGTSQTLTITVNPSPTVTGGNSNIGPICPGVSYTPVGFSSGVAGVLFNWTNNNTAIGLAASQTGVLTLPTFTPTNTSPFNIFGTIEVTPTANGCLGTPSSFTITVYPNPGVTAVSGILPFPAVTACSGAGQSAITLVPTISTSETYNWTSSNTTTITGIAASATGVTSFAAYTPVNITNTVVATTTITITPVLNGCLGTTTQSFNINVDPPPTVNAITSQSVCNGTPTTAVTFTGNIPGTTYNWVNNNIATGLAAVGASTVSIPSFTAINTGLAPIVSLITVTPSYLLCPGGATAFSITVNPTPTANAVPSQVLCNGSVSTPINFSGPVAGTGFIWTNSNSSIGLGSGPTGGNISAFLATNAGSVPLTGAIAVTPSANGCAGPVQNFSVTVNPTPTVNVPANQNVCNGVLTAPITFTGAVSGSIYSWTSNTPGIGLSASGTGNVGAFIAVNSGTSIITDTIVITPSAYGCSGTPQMFTITINPTPTVGGYASQSVCNGALSAAENFTGPVAGTNFYWSNSNTVIGLGASSIGNIAAFTGTNGGTAPVSGTISVTPVANGCSGVPQNFIITVNPTPTVAGPANQAVCNGTGTAAVNFTGTVGGTAYAWTGDNALIGLALSGSGNIPSFTAINTGISLTTDTIVVTPSANGCAGASQSFEIAVNPTPTVAASPNQTICNGASSTPVTFSGAVPGTTFGWTNSNATIGIAASGVGSIPSFTAINHGTLPVTATVRVTPSAAGCSGAVNSFTITVDPTPAVSPSANQAVCNGSFTTAVAFSATVSGSTFAWTNSNTTIGLGTSSGSGNIASFRGLNSTNAQETAVITVTPSASGCAGAPRSFTITVNPTPTMTTVPNQVVCNDASTSVIGFTGAVLGTSFSWTNSNPGIGIATSGTGDISSFRAVNPGTSAVTDMLTVTPSANGCTGATESISITVDPTPGVVAPSNQTVCNGASTTPVIFSGPVTGTAYSWTNSISSIGLAAAGTGNIPSFASSNLTFAPEMALITVTPAASGCAGASQSFIITVNPTPDVAAPVNQVVCNTASTTAVMYSGDVTGTTYSWTNSATSIGLAGAGTGNIASFMASNSDVIVVTSTIIVTPHASGCVGAPQNFTITVNPTPSVIAPANQTVCNGLPTAEVDFTGLVSSAAYNWVNSNSGIGLASIGTGNILSFTATNSGATPMEGTISVTPVANGCSGTTQNFGITVNPTPIITVPAGGVSCNGTLTTSFNFTSTVTGTSYSWTNDMPSIGIGALGTGNINPFMAVNTSDIADTANITVTPTAMSCVGLPQSFTIMVNPTPLVSAVPNQVECNGDTTSTVNFTGNVSGSVFNWIDDNPGIGLGAATGTGDIDSFATTNSGITPSIDVITVTASASGCTGGPQHFQITVNPTPTVIAPANQTLCNGAATTAATFSGAVTGTTYLWANSNTTTGLGASGSGNIASFMATNSTFASDTAVITVTPVASGCTGTTQSFAIAVNPTPDVAAISGQTVCNNDMTSSVTFSGDVSATTFAWVNSNPGIGLSPTGSGNIGAFTTINTGTSAVTALVTVTPEASGCIGMPQNFSITVNPTPAVTTPASQIICNGVSTSAVTFSSLVSGATYTWANNNSGIGLAATGSGNIASFMGTNPGNTPAIAVITVTPMANGCTGYTSSFEITVNPTPSLTAAPTNQTLCNNATTTAENFNGTVTGTTFAWTNINPAIGLPTAGTGNILPFVALNITTVPEQAVITVTPTAEYCVGPSQSFTVTVNPTPDVVVPASQELCSGSATAPVDFTGSVSTTVYSWTNSNTGIGLSTANGAGNIPSFTATNNTSNATIVTAIFNVTPKAYGCTGASQDFTIAVDPNPVAPVISTEAPSAVCSNTQYQNFGTSTPAPQGAEYTWSVSNATLNQVGAGNQYCLISFPNAGASMVTLTSSYTATNCISQATYSVEVSSDVAGDPTLIFENFHFICEDNNSASYTWGYDNVNTLDSSLIPGQSSQDYMLPYPDFADNYYWVMTKDNNGCIQKSYYSLPTTGVTTTASQTGIHMNLYPNPAGNILNITFSGTAMDGIQAQIFDVSGREVISVPVMDNKAAVNVDKMTPGVYSVSCYKDGIRIATSTFVKQ